METISDPYQRHLFDNDSIFNHEESTNLTVGVPGPDLLQNCVEIGKNLMHYVLHYTFQYVLLLIYVKIYFVVGRRKERRKVLSVSIWHHSRLMGVSRRIDKIFEQTLRRCCETGKFNFNMRSFAWFTTFVKYHSFTKRDNFCRSYLHDSIRRFQTISINENSRRYYHNEFIFFSVE